MEKRFIKLTLISLLIGLISTIITYCASYYIHMSFGEPIVVRDLLWEILPYFDVMFLCEIFLCLSIVILLLHSFENKYLIPYAITIISIFHIIRAFMIILTPLGFPHTYTGFIHSTNHIFTYGAFPSGHLSVPYLIFMITKNKKAIILAFLVGLTLLISRGHYSIDLIGTLLVAYPVFKFSEKYIRKYFK